MTSETATKWVPAFYGSGTCTVTRHDSREPHLYVYGPRNENEDDWMRARYKMCYELAEWLNDGKRPAWLDDLKRTEEGYAFDLDGTCIYATGPVYDADPPNLNWKQCDDEESRNARARLIDLLMKGPQ
jgi:hypothetical protein